MADVININTTGIDFFTDKTQDNGDNPKSESKPDNVIYALLDKAMSNSTIAEKPKTTRKKSTKSTKESKILSEMDSLILDEEKPVVKSKKSTTTKTKTDQDVTDVADQADKKQSLLMTCYRYRDSKIFGEYLKKEMGFKFDTLNRKTIPQLEETLAKIRFAVNNKSTDQDINNLVWYICAFCESFVTKHSKHRILLIGMTDILKADETFCEDLERFKLEYMGFANIDYRTRMLWTIVSAGMRAHAINKSSILRQEYTKTKNEAKPNVDNQQSVNLINPVLRGDNINPDDDFSGWDDQADLSKIEAEIFKTPESPKVVKKKAKVVKKKTNRISDVVKYMESTKPTMDKPDL